MPELIPDDQTDAPPPTSPASPETPDNAPTLPGPRPGGGTFHFRPRTTQNTAYPADSPSNVASTLLCLAIAPDRSDQTCIIVPNSSVGRSLQAISNAQSDNSPRNRKAALAHDKTGWLQAEAKELSSHDRNQSWSIIDYMDVPAGRRIIRMIWVYKVKRDGTLKARLCVQGSSQRPGEDFDQTFCAAMRSTSLRILAAASVKLSLNMRRIDFVSAYLQGKLEEGEVVYCHMPEGYVTTNASGRARVLRIEKPVYGLAQAGRRWQRTLFPWLLKQGFVQSKYDSCVFIMRKFNAQAKRDEIILLGCYVDDLLVCTSHEDKISLFQAFSSNLQRDWEVEDEGEAVDLLNVQFAKTECGILLHQRPYIEKMLARFSPDGIPLEFQRNKTPCTADLPTLVRETMDQDFTPSPDVLHKYQSLVGSLLYAATMTRPDIAFAVGMLCRAMSKPTPKLYQSALDVLYYLGRHANIGLHYEADSNDMEIWSDSDWAIKHSTTGYDVRWQRASISFGSKKQNCVATASCHAEIIAASEAAKEAPYHRGFAEEIGLPQSGPTTMRVDNQAAIDLAYNPEHHNRTKHIDRRHFYVRECVEEHITHVQYVKSADNLADIFTKPLPPKTFFRLRNTIMNVPGS